MKNKVLIILMFVAVISSFYLLFNIKDNHPITLDEVKINKKPNNTSMAIFLQKEDGMGYEISETNKFPDNMVLNTHLSKCVNKNGEAVGNILSNAQGNIKVRTDGSTKCYLYFDYEKSDIEIGSVDIAKLYSIAYKKDLSCNYSKANYSERFQRLEVKISGETGIKCNFNFNSITRSRKLTQEVANKAKLVGDSYRYQGKQPDNWVWFNNEYWRIIGSIPTCLNNDCSENVNLVKIIRSESLGGISYSNTSEFKYWEQSSLYTLLNDYYYGKQDATTNNYCVANSNDKKWPICNYQVKGISKEETDYYGKMIKKVYLYTGEVTDVTQLDSEKSRVSETTISLLTVRDYLNATPNNDDRGKDNWLNNFSKEWTMVPKEGTQTWAVGEDGVYSEVSGVDSAAAYNVRPVVYLNSEVIILSGTGEQDNPYILGL